MVFILRNYKKIAFILLIKEVIKTVLVFIIKKTFLFALLLGNIKRLLL